METVFYLKPSDLNINFLQTIKSLFENKDIVISVKDDMDETEYLLKEPANKKKLLQSVKNIENNKNLIRFTPDEFEKLNKKLLQE
ncbi:MAG: hypothetical protein HY738_12440 [Bacteroidia bacterium]|nr:hypothetical protein [Bacteroidia bacterium]